MQEYSYNNAVFSDRFEVVRSKSNKTITALAAEMGISRTMIYDIRNGKVPVSLNMLEKLCELEERYLGNCSAEFNEPPAKYGDFPDDQEPTLGKIVDILRQMPPGIQAEVSEKLFGLVSDAYFSYLKDEKQFELDLLEACVKQTNIGSLKIIADDLRKREVFARIIADEISAINSRVPLPEGVEKIKRRVLSELKQL